MAGAFCGVTVNVSRTSGITVQTNIHRDVKESEFGYSSLMPFGRFKGGASVLWDIKVVIEVGAGDLLFFPDALIRHSDEEVIGERGSIVAFTQENVLQWWSNNFSGGHSKDEKRIRRLKFTKAKCKKKGGETLRRVNTIKDRRQKKNKVWRR
jgi:hypothetical protein